MICVRSRLFIYDACDLVTDYPRTRFFLFSFLFLFIRCIAVARIFQSSAVCIYVLHGAFKFEEREREETSFQSNLRPLGKKKYSCFAMLYVCRHSGYNFVCFLSYNFPVFILIFSFAFRSIYILYVFFVLVFLAVQNFISQHLDIFV